jgi:hypothetical protein
LREQAGQRPRLDRLLAGVLYRGRDARLLRLVTIRIIKYEVEMEDGGDAQREAHLL